MIKYRHILFLSILLLTGVFKNATATDIKKIGIVHGLSNNNTISFAQDREGFIWIATKDGLNRFDANNFKVFRHSKINPNSISSNVLNCVYADKFDDLIWIATEKNGIDAYNYKTQRFTHYEHDLGGNTNSLISNGVTHITGDDKGNLWFATYMAGIDYFDKTTGEFTHYNQSNVQGLGSDYNWTVMCDVKGKLYVGHVNAGMSIIDIESRTAVNYRPNPFNSHSIPDYTVTEIVKDSKGRVWVGTRNGLALFDPATGNFTTFRNIPGNPNSLSHNFIQSICETNASELWIGTEGGGVNMLDLSQIDKEINLSEISFNHIYASETPDGLSSSSVQTILADSFGNLWIGGWASGINFIPNKEPFFKKINYLPIIGNYHSLNSKIVRGLCRDRNDNIWVANADGGLCIYNRDKKIKQFNNFDHGNNDQNIFAVHNDIDKNVWIGTNTGELYQLKPNSAEFIYHKIPFLINIPIYHIYKDADKNLWLSTDVGLIKYNDNKRKSHFYSTANTSMHDNNIRPVTEDDNGNLWVGTLGGGLGVYDKNLNLLYKYGSYFDFYSINDIYKDSKGNMWVASQNDLFLFKDYNSNSVVRIGTGNGLLENNIRAIIEGASPNDIWVSTTNGISYIQLETFHVSNFTVNDGIALGDYESGAKTKTGDGTIYFGSQNGITCFNEIPEQQHLHLPNTHFTNFLINDSKSNLNGFSGIPFSDTVELKHYQNTFQISFNILDYALSDKVEFVFQMKGLDNNWYFFDQEKHVTFRNLSPGNYVFNLKTRLHNADWNDNIATMHIKIASPFWSAWYAKLLYLLILIAGVALLVKFYKNKITIENDLLLEKKSREQEQQLNEEKIKFFTNITHELRTPLTLILGPLEDLISDNELTPEQNKKLTSIQRVATKLLYLINQILEFRKTSTKSRKLRVLKEDFAKFVYDTGNKYFELNQNKNLDLKLNVPDNAVFMFFDPDVVSIILDNLLSNAFKYTKKGSVKLALNNITEQNIQYTEIKVSDTGFGISAIDLPHIFERYYQAKKTSYPITGTGIGLALAKNMVELHDAEISVESELNKGSTFTVKFITNNSYPDAVHIHPNELQAEKQEKEVTSKKVVLVIDDNNDIVEYIHDSLIDSFHVLTAENGQKGFEIASNKTPDIVISDIMMPVMDGLEFCKTMKQDIRTSHIPIILLTAKGALQDQSVGYNAGADSYLTKPFSVNVLKSRLNNILETRKKLSKSYTSKFKDKQELFNDSINQLDKDFLDKLTGIIEEYLEDENMNISQIAFQMNMSHSTLYRKIKALTNLTANEYIRKVRITVAEKLLLTNKYTISEIMYRIGINSNSYFRQCFKDEFGMNPSEYLQKLKSNDKSTEK